MILDSFKLDGRVALVTGASAGLGTAIAVALQADETRNRQILERVPAERWGEPEDIAGAAVFLVSQVSDYLHGHILVVDGGWMGR